MHAIEQSVEGLKFHVKKYYYLVSNNNNNIKQIDFVQIIKSVSIVSFVITVIKLPVIFVCMGKFNNKCIKKSDICSLRKRKTKNITYKYRDIKSGLPVRLQLIILRLY